MNRLMQMLLESRGIYMDAADDQGSHDGMPAGQDQESGESGDADMGGESSNESDNGDDGSSSADNDGAGEKSDVDDKTAKLIKDMMKWKDRAKTQESANQELSKSLDKFNSVLGEEYTLEDIEQIIAERKDAQLKEMEKKGEYDRILEQMKEENKKALDTVNESKAEAESRLQAALNKLDELTVGRAFSDSKFIKENSVLPASIARKEFGEYFEHEDGEIVAYDKPKGAKDRTRLVDKDGNNKSFEEAIAHLYNSHVDKDDLLKSKRKPGSKSKSTESGKPTRTGLKGVDKISQGLAERNS